MEDLLEKWERLGQGLSMMNRDAHFQALMAVEPTIIKYVANLVDGMKMDDLREFMLFGHRVPMRKVMNDCYTGRFLAPNGDIVHYFDRQSIPQIAGQIQSYFELYTGDEELEQHGAQVLSRRVEEKLEQYAKSDGEHSLVNQLLQIFHGKKPTEAVPDKSKEEKQDAEVKKIIEDAKQLTVEARAKRHAKTDKKELMELREKIEGVLARVESIVKAAAPVRQSNDKTHALIADISRKHDGLVDRTQQELNILTEKIKGHSSEHSQSLATAKQELASMISATSVHMNEIRDQILAAMPSGSSPDVEKLKDQHDLLVDKTQQHLNDLAAKLESLALSHTLGIAAQAELYAKLESAKTMLELQHATDRGHVETKHDLLVDQAEKALNALEDRIAQVDSKLEALKAAPKEATREIVIRV